MHAKSIAVAMLLVLGAAAPVAMTATSAQAAQDQFKIIDVKAGTGAVAKAGQKVTVNYTGWLYVNGAKGKKFDSSLDHGTPFTFPLGAGAVILGWDKGVAGMKVGGKRKLTIPPSLGYGPDSPGAGISAIVADRKTRSAVLADLSPCPRSGSKTANVPIRHATNVRAAGVGAAPRTSARAARKSLSSAPASDTSSTNKRQAAAAMAPDLPP